MQHASTADRRCYALLRYVNPTVLTVELLSTLIEKILVREAIKGEDGSRIPGKRRKIPLPMLLAALFIPFVYGFLGKLLLQPIQSSLEVIALQIASNDH